MNIPKDVLGLAGIFAVSGTIHLVKPEVFEPIVPAFIPAREAVHASGVVELVCAAGLMSPRTRGIAGWASVALLAGVFPANVKMAKDARRSKKPAYRYGTIARLPLQVPMIRSALKAARAS
ncbi:MAG: hypothetical protein L0H93_07435 [Nocardioides sp.]|nr:hypothetical protein [Nocardioides sp.]